MLSAAYFRRQADICLRLSVITSDEQLSTRLVSMARNFMANGEAIERASNSAAENAPSAKKRKRNNLRKH